MASVVAARSPEEWWSATVGYSVIKFVQEEEEEGPCTEVDMTESQVEMTRALNLGYYDRPTALLAASWRVPERLFGGEGHLDLEVGGGRLCSSRGDRRCLCIV